MKKINYLKKIINNPYSFTKSNFNLVSFKFNNITRDNINNFCVNSKHQKIYKKYFSVNIKQDKFIENKECLKKENIIITIPRLELEEINLNILNIMKEEKNLTEDPTESKKSNKKSIYFLF